MSSEADNTIVNVGNDAPDAASTADATGVPTAASTGAPTGVPAAVPTRTPTDHDLTVALYEELGFSKDAAAFLATDQSINDPKRLEDLTDEQIESLCRLCRKPGGLATDPSNPSKRIPNPGTPVALCHENMLKLAVFFLKFRDVTSRPTDCCDAKIDAIKGADDFRREMEGHTNPDLKTAPALTAKRQFEFFDDLKEYLSGWVGSVSRRPISYVVRAETYVPCSADDPGFGQPDSQCRSYVHEIEERAPIRVSGSSTYDPHCLLDDQQVWKVIQSICKDTTCATCVKPFTKTKDGRGACTALVSKLLGEEAVNNYASRAESRLETLALDGLRKKNWNFEKHVLAHMEQHQILEKLKDFGCAGLDENSKIRHFNKGVTDPALKTVKASLSAVTNKTFDLVVRTHKSCIEAEKIVGNKKETLNVSQFNTSSTRNRGNRKGSSARKIGPEDDGCKAGTDYSRHKCAPRFYKTQEWNQLSAGNRNCLREHGRNKRAEKSTNDKDSQIRRLEREIAELEARAEANEGRKRRVTFESDEDSSGDEPPTPRLKKKLKSLKRGPERE